MGMNIGGGSSGGGRRHYRRANVMAEINVTPMLDLAYVLLIVFILMTTAAVQGVQVNLPKASNTPSLSKPQTKATFWLAWLPTPTEVPPALVLSPAC